MSIFISHASEDKELIVRPLANEISKYVEVWYDEEKISVGDSLTEKINEGLSNTKFAIIVLSENFFNKEWAKRELNSLLSKMTNNSLKVIPLFYGVTPKWVSEVSPLLADILGLKVTVENIVEVSAKILAVVKPEIKTEIVENKIVSSQAEFNIVDTIVDGKQLELELKQVISKSGKKSWNVIENRFGIGGSAPRTLDEIGILHGLTRERIRQIESKALKYLRAKYLEYNSLSCLIEKIEKIFNDSLGIINESMLIGELLSLIENEQNIRPYLMVILKSLDYELTKHTSKKIENLFVDTKKFKVKMISNVVDFIDRFLYEKSPESLKREDLFIATRKKYRVITKDLKIESFESILININTIQRSELEDEYDYRFEYLNNTKKSIEKLLFENGEITKLNDLYSALIARGSEFKKGKKIAGIENIRNQLSSDDRFFSIGKSGNWGLSIWGNTQNKTILDLIKEALKKSDVPLSIDQIFNEIKSQRPVSRNSVVIYLNDRNDLFQEYQNYLWGEKKRSYSDDYSLRVKAKRKVKRTTLTQQQKVEQFIIKTLSKNSVELSKLVNLINKKFEVSRASIYGIISKSEKVEKVVDKEGVKFCRVKKEAMIFSTEKLPAKYKKKVESILEDSVDLTNIHYAYLDLSSLFETSVKNLILKCKTLPKYRNATINNENFKPTLNNYIQFIEKENLLRDPSQLKDLQTKRNYIHHFEIGDEDKARLLIKGAEYYLNSYINRIVEIESVLSKI